MRGRMFLAVMLILTACSPDDGKGEGPMGGQEDVAYAEKLWSAMVKERLVGADAKRLEPFFGGAKPHGMILELATWPVSVDDHTGFLVVKNNYDGEGVSVEAVKKDRKRFLSSVTIMYQREKGYDPDNLNWFWAKYRPDGSLFDKGGVKLAGRIKKAKSRDDYGGCLYCHSSAGGGDYIFYPDIKLPGFNYDQ